MIIYDPKITGSFDVNGTSISSLDQIDVTSGSVSSLNDATSSYALIAEISGSTTSLSSSLASELLKNTTDTLTGDLTVTGTLTAQDLHVQEVTSSIVFSSGSNKFGSLSSDTQEFTGSLQVSGSTNYLLGNVGIGTTNPISKLHIDGGLTNSANASQVFINNTTTGEPAVIALRSVADNGGVGNTGAIYFDAGADGAAHNNLIAFNADHQTDTNYDVVINGNGNVGIGTTSPSVNLDIERTGNVIVDLNTTTVDANTTIRFQEAGTNTATIGYHGTSDGLVLTTGGFTAGNGIFIDNSQRVGIGISAITANTNADDLQIGDGTGGNRGLTITAQNNSGAAVYFGDGDDTDIGSIRYDNSNNSMKFFTNTAETMRIASNGNVGIGTTTPSTKLYVYGGTGENSAKVTIGGNDAIITLGDNQSGGPHGIQFDYGPGDVDGMSMYYRTTPEHLSFEDSTGIGGSSIMVISRYGNVGIGTTSPTQKLDILNSDNIAGIRVENSSASFTSTGLLINNTSSTNGELFRLRSSGANRFIVVGTGNVGIGTSSPSGLLTIHTGASGTYDAIVLSRDTYGEAGVIKQAAGGLEVHSQKNLVLGADEDNTFTGTSSNIIFKVDGSESGRFNSAGNLGIGTTSPEDKLHVYGQLKADQIKTRSFSSLSGSPSSGDWFPIGTISDTNPSIVTYYVKTYAHSSIAFTVSEGYSADNRGHVQIIDHIYSANGGYANVSGVRIRQNGVVEIKLVWSSGPSVNIKITAVGVQAPEISTSLAATTETSTVVDTIEVSGNYGMMRAAGNILAQGNIGVGTTDPSDAKVTIAGSGNPVGIGDEYGHTGIKFYGAQTGQLEIFNNRGNSTYGNTIFTNSSGESMRIDASNRVGIGTTSIDKRLEVAAASNTDGIRIQGSNANATLTIQNNGTGGNAWDISSTGAGHGYGNGNLIFGVTFSPKVTFKSDGYILNGGHAANDGVSPTLNGWGLNPNGTATGVCNFSTSNEMVVLNQRDGSGTTQFEFRNGNVERGRIEWTTSGTTYNTNSDYRLKENVTNLTGSLAKVDQLEPKAFNFISDPDEPKIGFIAHEVQDIVPQAVSGVKDAVREDGTPKYQGLDHSMLVPLLVGAIKELKADNEALKARIETLENS